MIYFFSDAHLGYGSRASNLKRENLLLKFFGKICRDAEVLFIVGDLFDYWFEYSSVAPKYFYRVLAALKDLRLSGIKIEYIIGNHDFGHKDFFEKELDIPLIKEDAERTFYGKRFYVTHGDGKDASDKRYLILKKILRSPLAQKLYRGLHPDFGIWLASKSSAKSRDYTSQKYWGENDALEKFAVAKFEEGFDFFVTGHRHKPELKRLKGKTFVDVGDWLRPEPTFAMFDGEEIELKTVSEFLNSRNG